MKKSEMELIWNGPMQDALRIVKWRPVMVLELRADGRLMPWTPKRSKPVGAAKKGKAA